MLEKLEHVLRQAAKDRRTLTYFEAARALGLSPPNMIEQAVALLEELMRIDAYAGQPQWACLVVGRARAGLPGPGFFMLARDLKLYHGSLDGEDARVFHEAEKQRCFEAAAAVGA
jgi:hypothetical protein